MAVRWNKLLIIFFFLVVNVSFSQEKNPTVYPYGGVPDSIRFKKLMADTGRISYWPHRVPLNFQTADFGQDIIELLLENGVDAQFDDNAYFEWAKFLSRADFMWTIFNSRAYFYNAEFDSLADFNEATFNDTTDFSVAEFNGRADFTASKFDGPTSFIRAEFDSLAIFDKVEFDSLADFGQASFQSRANFRWAKFGSLADFGWAKFDSLADFGWAKFGGRAVFVNAEFHYIADYEASEFDSLADFGWVHFDNFADFRYAKFHILADFERAEFDSLVDFEWADFDGLTNFEGAKFKNNIDYESARFKDRVNFNSAVFNRKINFREAHIDSMVDFSLAEIKDTISVGIDKLNELQSYDFTRAMLLEDGTDTLENDWPDGILIKSVVRTDSTKKDLQILENSIDSIKANLAKGIPQKIFHYPGAKIVLYGPVNLKMQLEKLKFLALYDKLDYYSKKDIISTLKQVSFKGDQYQKERFELDYIFDKSTMYQKQSPNYKMYSAFNPIWWGQFLYNITMGLGYRPFRLAWWVLGFIIVFTFVYYLWMPGQINKYIAKGDERKTTSGSRRKRTRRASKPHFTDTILNCFYFSSMMFFTFRLKRDILTFFSTKEKRVVVGEWLIGLIIYISFLTLSKSGSILHTLKSLFVG